MTNTTNHAPAGIDLDKVQRFDFTKDYLGDGEYSYFMEESGAGEYVRFADVESLLARRAAADAPAADERALFEVWMKARPGYPFAGAFANLMWDAWQARAAHPIGQVSPAIDAVQTEQLWHQAGCAVGIGTQEHKFKFAQLLLAAHHAPVCHAPANDVLAAICEEAGYANLSMQRIREILDAHGCMISVVSPSDATGKADSNPYAAPGWCPDDEPDDATGKADCHDSCGYIGAECDFPHCKGTSAADAMDAALTQARDALNGLLWQFTSIPSTYRESNARAQGHAAIKAIDSAMAASRDGDSTDRGAA